jgi:hypothetical protein
VHCIAKKRGWNFFQPRADFFSFSGGDAALRRPVSAAR